MTSPPRKDGPHTVLVVDDEAALRVITRLSLQREGYTVLEAATPDEALRLAAGREAPIDLLLMDVDLAGIRGNDLAGRLAATRPDLKVLFCSGHDRMNLVRRGVLGDDAPFLEK